MNPKLLASILWMMNGADGDGDGDGIKKELRASFGEFGSLRFTKESVDEHISS